MEIEFVRHFANRGKGTEWGKKLGTTIECWKKENNKYYAMRMMVVETSELDEGPGRVSGKETRLRGENGQ
jgi:hypothetical protein